MMNIIFEILQNEQIFQQFLNLPEEEQEFEVNGQKVNKKEVLIEMSNLFGNPEVRRINTDIELPIDDIDKCFDRYARLHYKYNLERYTNLEYEFRKRTDLNSKIIRKEQEPQWEINSELRDKIYNQMPTDISLEEQVMYIYCMLCRELNYDEGYFYRQFLDETSYAPTFSKDHLESIKPGSNVTCYDFSRVLAKLINQLEGDIEAVIISEGNNAGHFSVRILY